MTHTLHLGDCRDVLATMDDNSIDAIVCDPPYELGFMGKAWDASGIAYDVTVWAHCLRVLKPGGHLIAFGGTRTYHRMAVAIEDAGFEIRDQIQWIYGSGFPKSLDVSKAMDKQAGAVRDVVGDGGRSGITRNAMAADFVGQWNITAPSTDLAKQWHGWGTAIKPAVEPAVIAYKRHEAEHDTIVANLIKLEAQLWLMQFACSAEWSSTSSPSESNEALSTAQWNAVELINTRDDLLELMDISQLSEMASLCLSIVQLWKYTWVEASKSGSTFITGTVISPIIGWTTLKSSVSHLTLHFITKEWMQHGTEWLNALSAASPFIVASKKLKSTLELIAVERAISRTSNPGLIDTKTTNEPAVLARKPLRGTVADNVTAWGVGALNIDGTRVAHDEPIKMMKAQTNKESMTGNGKFGQAGRHSDVMELKPSGRWPSNVILDEDAASLLGEPSRFFYVAKASMSEREAGLDGVEAHSIKGRDIGEDSRNVAFKLRNNPRANHHPCVKPLALMRYLVRMVTPTGGVVLDPFMGSGSTGCAAVREGFDFVGIDLTPEYVAIAQKRIDWHAVTSPLDNVPTMELHEENEA